MAVYVTTQCAIADRGDPQGPGLDLPEAVGDAALRFLCSPKEIPMLPVRLLCSSPGPLLASAAGSQAPALQRLENPAAVEQTDS